MFIELNNEGNTVLNTEKITSIRNYPHNCFVDSATTCHLEYDTDNGLKTLYYRDNKDARKDLYKLIKIITENKKEIKNINEVIND